MLKYQSNKFVFVLAVGIVILFAVLSVRVSPVVSQSVGTQETDDDFSTNGDLTQSSAAGTLVCNSPAATFDSGLPVDWTSIISTGSVSWSTTDNLAVCNNGYQAGGTAPGACS